MIPPGHPSVWKWLAAMLALALLCLRAFAVESEDTARFRKDVQPILTEYCYDCHGDGVNKGDIALDEFKSDDALADHELWARVMKNLRANLMPPHNKSQPTADEQKQVEDWIKYSAFSIDPKNPDPGRVTVRRLNRVEYRNTIRDLMGVDFNADVEFPPDDTGYGFDNIGDVLTVSPMLMEKYIAAANTIVTEAMPTVSRVTREHVIAGEEFRAAGTRDGGGRRQGNNRRGGALSLPFDKPAAGVATFEAENPGSYQVIVQLTVNGGFFFDAAKCRFTFNADGRELLQKEFGWHDNKKFQYEFDQQWQPGEHAMDFDLKPTAPAEDTNTIQMRIVSVTVRGPMEKQHWIKPPNYDRFFTRDVPQTAAEQRQYAAELLNSFATRAFRRPVDSNTVERLVTLAEVVYSQPDKTFENGIAYATAAVLASPRFLFRIEEAAPDTPRGARYAYVDEYSLASRLSYFLWSTMPDAELFRLADRGELRKNLPAQIRRMLDDPRSEALVENFTGQWLQTRDVEGISINAREVLARDSGIERELREEQAARQARQAQRNAQATDLSQTNAPGVTNQVAQAESARRRFNRFRPRVELDGDLRAAMKRETHMSFSTIMREDRSVTELIDSDYTFLNQKLAGYYGLTNLDITGSEMRRVTLPPDSPRGGILTHGSVLVVTSNPDRTSPVKRGLFVLDNVLGTPAPPAPGNIPALEVAEKEFTDHEPTLRESLAAHRDKPLCASCHMRMDPLGLAFENFNAMGMWREEERNQPIDTAGKLITGESFTSVRELKRILANERRNDFYRCLSEKLLTYALGRGLEYYDTETVDQLVQRLEQGNGRFLPLLTGIIESAPFQKQRLQANPMTAEAPGPPAQSGAVKQLADNQTPP